MRSKPCRAWFAIFSSLVTVSCDGTDSNGALPVVQPVHRDSAGVSIVTSAGDSERYLLGWNVSEEPVLEIGVPAGSPEYQLFRIGGVAELSDGRILIIDGGARELRWFGQDGAFLRSVGGSGEGPGQFGGEPALVPAQTLDSIIVFDRRLQRFSVFSLEGAHLATHPSIELPETSISTPLGDQSLRTITAAVGMVGDQVLTLHTMLMMTDSEGIQPADPAEFRLIDPAGGASQVIGLFEGEQSFHTSPDPAGQIGRLRLPFDAAPSGAVGDGKFFLIPTGEPEIRQHGSAGELERLLRVDTAPRPITDQALNAYIQSLVDGAANAELAQLFEREYRQVELPEAIPAFEKVLADADEWVWAKIYAVGESENLWLVFDPEGSVQGAVSLPAGLDVHQIGSDFIIGVAEDDRGVESVQRYRLSRGPESSQ